MSLRHVLGALLLIGSFDFIHARPVLAQFPPDPNAVNPVDIGSVTVLPEGTLTPADEVSLSVQLMSGNCCISLLEPTQVEVIGNDVLVDVFAGSGLLTIPDGRFESVPLGTFVPGTYFFEVRQNGPSLSQSQVSGTFRVVPEPRTAGMIVAGVVMLLLGFSPRNGRHASCQPARQPRQSGIAD